ncbi:unnamed protein product [Closterium sp. NIES-64]|nr:unnamed protein product [Closterium sp. NIES-64]
MFPASSIHGGAARASGSSPSLSASVSGGDGDSDVLDHRQLLGLLQVERRDAWGDVRGDSGGAGLWRLVPIAKELTLDAGHFIAVRAIQELRERNRSSGGDRPLLVGIGGPSGSGKSSLAHRIASMLEGTVIEQVNYMDAARGTGDMHDVDALDMALLHRHMQDLLAGRPIEMPLFDSVDRRRSGFRLITPSPSAVILLKGVYALHSRLRPLLDLGIAVVGGVHYTLLQRVKSDVAQSGLQLSLASVMHSVFPAFPLHIEPTLAHAEIRISNSFVADSLRHPFYILKSDQTVAEDRVKQVLGSTRTTRNEYRYVDVYLCPPHNPTRTKEWIRVRQCGIRYFLSVGDQRVVDRSFIIRPRAEFEVPSTTLPGLIQCSYAVAVSFSRDSVVLSNGDLSVCIDTIHLGEGHSRTYTQIKGPDRQTVLAAAAALRLEGPWVTDAYVDIVMRHVGAPRLPTPPLSSSWVRFESDQIESLTSSPSSSSFLSVPSSQPPLSTTPELPQYQPPAPPPPPSQSPPLSHSAIPSPPYPSQLPFTASPPPSQSPLPARISAALSAASAPLPVRPRAINVGSPGSSGGGGTAGGVESRPGERGVEERGVESGVEEQEPWTRSPTRASEAAALAAPASWGLTGLADSVGLMHTQMIQQVMAGGGAAEVKPSPSASAASATDATGAVTSTTSTTSRSSSTSTAGGVAAAEEGMGAAGGEGIYGATSRLATSAVGAREPLGAAGAAVSDRRQQASVQQASVQQASVQQASVQQASVRQASVQQASVQQASVQQASVQQASVQQASVQQASVRQASVRQASVQQASVQQASVQQASVQQASVQQASVQQASVQQASVQQASVRQASVQQASVQHARWEDSGSSEARGGEQQREQGGGQQGGQQGGGGMAEGGAARYRGAEGRTGGPSEQERGRGTAQGGISTQRGGVEPEMGGAASEMGGQASASQRARFDLIPKREQFNFDRGLGLAVMAVQKLLRSNGPPVIVGIGEFPFLPTPPRDSRIVDSGETSMARSTFPPLGLHPHLPSPWPAPSPSLPLACTLTFPPLGLHPHLPSPWPAPSPSLPLACTLTFPPLGLHPHLPSPWPAPSPSLPLACTLTFPPLGLHPHLPSPWPAPSPSLPLACTLTFPPLGLHPHLPSPWPAPSPSLPLACTLTFPPLGLHPHLPSPWPAPSPSLPLACTLTFPPLGLHPHLPSPWPAPSPSLPLACTLTFPPLGLHPHLPSPWPAPSPSLPLACTLTFPPLGLHPHLPSPWPAPSPSLPLACTLTFPPLGLHPHLPSPWPAPSPSLPLACTLTFPPLGLHPHLPSPWPAPSPSLPLACTLTFPPLGLHPRPSALLRPPLLFLYPLSSSLIFPSSQPSVPPVARQDKPYLQPRPSALLRPPLPRRLRQDQPGVQSRPPALLRPPLPRVCSFPSHMSPSVSFLPPGGPSGSGKTSLACNLARLLSCDLLSLDSFFNDTADGTNYDDVAVVDWPLLRRTLQDVREGRNAVTPVFDFGTMRRVGYRPVHMHGDGHGHADLVLEGTHTLHPLLQHRLDLRIAVDGGVHSHLPARVLSDLQTCSLPRPAEEVEATLFPLFRTQIQPFLSTAHLRVVNKFDPFHARDASQFVLKSDKKVTEEDILRVVDPSTHHRRQLCYTDVLVYLPGLHPQGPLRDCILIGISLTFCAHLPPHHQVTEEDILRVVDPSTHHRRQLCYTDVFFYLPGLHPEGPVRESDWIRVRCCNNRFAVLIREPLTEGDFVIQPQVEFDIGLSTVAGLVRLGYQAGLFMEVSATVFQDDQVSLEVVGIKGLNGRRFVQIKVLIPSHPVRIAHQISVEVVGIKGLNGRRFVQIKGSSRDAVAAAGRAMRLEGTYVTKPFVEIIHDSNRVFFSESVDVHHSQQAAHLHALLQRVSPQPAGRPPARPAATTQRVPSAAAATSAPQQPAATSSSPSTASLAARLQLLDARLTSLERMQFLNTALLGSLLLCCCIALLFSRRPHR